MRQTLSLINSVPLDVCRFSAGRVRDDMGCWLAIRSTGWDGIKVFKPISYIGLPIPSHHPYDDYSDDQHPFSVATYGVQNGSAAARQCGPQYGL